MSDDVIIWHRNTSVFGREQVRRLYAGETIDVAGARVRLRGSPVDEARPNEAQPDAERAEQGDLFGGPA